ncbi:MAG: CapA family protein [Myxococcota bacterium]
MRKTLLISLALFTGACAGSKSAEPTAAPAPKAPEVAETEPVVETALEPEVAVEPTISEADKARARELLETGRTVQREKGEGGAEEALGIYEQALDLDPKLAAAYWEMGWSYQVLDRLGEAVDAWDKVKEIDPEFPELETHYPVLKMRFEQKEKLSKLPDPGTLPEPELRPYDGPTLTFAAVGDVQTGRAWPEHRAVLPPNDAEGYFDGVKDWLQDADVTFGNLEQVLADGGNSSKCGPKSTKCFSFRVPTAHAKMLADVGFDMMSIANNHAGDFGPEGRKTTMETLDQYNIAYSGPVGVVGTKEVKGLRIGLVAFSTGGGTYQLQKTELARKIVADVDRTHDIVMVSFHGGAEGSSANHVPREIERFYGENRGNVYEFAHAMVDSGADLVFGHGPHCLRGTEIYKGRFVSYSLGNFSSYKTFNLSRNLGWSTVMNVTIAPNGVALSAKLNPVIIRDPGKPMKDKQRRALKEVRKLSKEDFGDAMFDAKGEWRRPTDEGKPVAMGPLLSH